jgi:hypothetical protein
MMADPKKHHYIPVSYLKRWAGPDNRICEFSKPYRGIVRPKRVYPDGTGYERELYTIRGLHPELAEIFER